MSLNGREVGFVSEVLDAGLKGAVSRKVISPKQSGRIVLELRGPGINHYLQIVIEPRFCRLGRVASKPASQETPHPFVMLLRRELGGASVQSIEQINSDRAVRFQFVSREKRRGTLICEMTSRHANIFWLGPDGRIEGSFGPNRSHKRKLVPGELYVPPLARQMAQPFESRFGDLKGIEERVEAHYSDLEEKVIGDLRTSHVRRLLKGARRHLKRLETRLEADKENASEAEVVAGYGHLLKANLYLITRGMSEVGLYDFEGVQKTIALDPKLDGVGNMQKYYARAKRLSRASPKIEERMAHVSKGLKWCVATEQEFETADDSRLQEITNEITRRFPSLAQRASKKKGEAPTRLPYREVVIANGRPARVGRSAADNDTLTLRHAKPHDLWLHVRGMTGSHVVVPLGRGEDPSPELLIDAAHLAAHFSDAKKNADVEVIYTKRKYVQKPKGAPAGSVRLLKEKTIALRVEPKRITRLLAQ
jgi:predicted ribosome quality control (RQC) complex YloA/Tae2 family protein